MGVSNPSQIVANLQSLAVLVVVLVVGLVAIANMARHRLVGILIVILGGALVYMAIKGSLVPDVAGWLQQIGL